MGSNGFNAIENLTLETRVYREILQAIVSGKISPGTQITISELAGQLGVSLMPVRQALKALAAKNLVYIMKNRRLMIRRLSISDLEELFEIRLQLEHRAAEQAARSCAEATVRRLEQLLEQMSATEDRELYLEKNMEFHHTIYRSADRPILYEIIVDLWHRISPYMYLYLCCSVQNHDSFHRGMIEGLRKRNPQEVSRWLEADLRQAAAELSEQLREVNAGR